MKTPTTSGFQSALACFPFLETRLTAKMPMLRLGVLNPCDNPVVAI